MPTFYCRHGESFHGDGTTNAAAIVAGGVGAFNDVLVVLDGTVLAPDGLTLAVSNGDNVILKTTLPDNTSNIVVSMAANLTVSGGAVDALKTYIFDDGTEWANAAGAIRLESTTSRGLTFAPYAHVLAGEYRLVWVTAGTSSADSYIRPNNYSYFDGLHFISNQTANNVSSGLLLVTGTQGKHGRYKSEVLNFGNTSERNGIKWDGKGSFELDEFHFIYNGSEAGANANPIIDGISSDGFLRIKRMILRDMPNNINITENQNGDCFIVIDSLMHNNKDWDLHTTPQNAVQYGFTKISIAEIKVDALKDGNYVGNYDFWDQDQYVNTAHDSLGNYPYLDSLLPDDVTPWSIYVSFNNARGQSYIKRTSEIKNVYDQASGILTLGVEALIYTGFLTPTNNDFFLTVSYEDINGIIRQETTRNLSALTASLAAWSANSYARTDFSPFKMELTTKFQVATNTTIHATTYCNAIIPDSVSYNFINPKLDVS